MWTIRRNHQHIKFDALSEYLDGRLQAGALDRVEQQLAACGVCRDELESLRVTVGLLRELPVAAPRRSFIMAAPPPVPVRPQPSTPSRLPQWAYAGAASMAAVVLAVLVSADATGLLSPEQPKTIQTAAAPRAQQPDGEVTEAAPEIAESIVQERESLEQEAPVAAAAAAAPLEPVIAAAAEEDSEAAAPVAKALPEKESRADITEPEPPAAALPDKLEVPIAGPEHGAVPEARREGTAAFWRVLEGLAAALGLVFLAGLVLKWRMARRGGRA